MMAGIREVLIIVSPNDLNNFKRILGNGSQLGMELFFEIQIKPEGIPQAFLIGEKFIDEGSVALILGDNIFHGTNLDLNLRNIENIEGALIFSHRVTNPENYGVVVVDREFKPLSIVEKPTTNVSNLAIPGLYFYDRNVVSYTKKLKKSARGELEIVDLHNIYLQNSSLKVSPLPNGTAWLDMGTFDSLNDASSFVRVLEQRHGQKLGCIEEIAWKNGWISDLELKLIANEYLSSGYGNYLIDLIQ